MYAASIRAYADVMSGRTIQVRDVPQHDADELRRRAAAQGVSVSAYLRALIHDDTQRPSMVDVMERIASRTPVTASVDDVRQFIDDDRTPCAC